MLWRWVEEEVYHALAEGILTVGEMRAELHPGDLLLLTVRMLRDGRHTESVSRNVLQELGDHYHDRLTNDLEGLLDSGIDLNLVVSIVSFLKQDTDLHTIGEDILNEDNLETLDRVARAMVTVNQWQGTDGVSPELIFNGETLMRLFSEEAIIRLAQRLPVALPLSSINKEEVSPENRGYFARAHVKAAAETLS